MFWYPDKPHGNRADQRAPWRRAGVAGDLRRHRRGGGLPGPARQGRPPQGVVAHLRPGAPRLVRGLHRAGVGGGPVARLPVSGGARPVADRGLRPRGAAGRAVRRPQRGHRPAGRAADAASGHPRPGGPAIMRDQLCRLADAAARPNVTLQVLPFTTAAHVQPISPFTMLEFPDPADPAVVYTEHLTGSLFLENEDEIRRYSVVFDHLRAEALGTGQSVDLIARVAAGLA